MGYSELFHLSKEDLWEALKEYPETSESLLEKKKAMLRKEGMLDESACAKSGVDSKEKVLLVQGKAQEAQERVARLMAQMLSSKFKLKKRTEALKANVSRLKLLCGRQTQ